MDIHESKIIITGGAKGIGNALALNLCKTAAKIIVIDNDEESLNAINKDLGIATYCCDLTVYEEVSKIIAKIYEEHGNINVLINNAGFIHSEPLFNMLNRNDPKHSVENWRKTIDINLNTVFNTSVNVVEKMYSKRVKGGVIINISSISAQGNIGQSAYSAAKAGIEALTKTWSKELGMFKIRCVAIAPGFINTESTKSSLNESMLKKWEQSVALKRLGTVEEIISSIKFIIENDYFNGKILSVDGGLNI